MPLSKSAKKSYRSSERKRAHNLIWEAKIKQSLKKVDKKNVNEVICTIDKATKRNIISKNKAARLKSRIAKKFGTEKKVETKQKKQKKVLEKRKTVRKSEPAA